MTFKNDLKTLISNQLFRVKKRISLKKKFFCNKIAGDYLITTDNGLFRLNKNNLEKISSLPCFGISINVPQDEIFISTWNSNSSQILKSKLSKILSKNLTSWQTLFKQTIINDASRIHQISYNNNHVWIANTSKNAITKICSQTGKWIANICPFRCSYGHEIDTDHNHVNSVLAEKNYLIFTAFKANKKGVIGLIGKGKIIIFLYKNFGIHDCLIHDKKFMFSDSFSAWDNKDNGSVIFKKEKKFEKIFENQKAQFIRGISICENEFIVGSSNFGCKKKRFKKNGKLIHIIEDKKFHIISVDASQIYDITRIDGKKTNCNFSKNLHYDEVLKILQRSFGKAKEDILLNTSLVGINAKKFDKSDQGNVDEYL